MASGKNARRNDTGSWILIAVLFVVGLWPIALIVLFVKLFGADEKKRRVPPPLEQQELMTIWHSAQKFYAKVQQQDGYVPPELYNDDTSYKPDDFSDVGQAEVLAKHFSVDYDETGSIGKRYRRQGEIGTPFCVTYDFDSEEDQAVTVRDRDTMEQERIKISDLDAYFAEKFAF